VLGTAAGKTKQHARHHRVHQTRKSTAAEHAKVQYEPSQITEEDEAQFAACRTKAAKVCMLLSHVFDVHCMIA